QVLNHRYNSQLPTVVTTNLNVDRLDERLRMRLTDPAIARVYHVEAAAKAVDANLPDALDLDRIREMTFENFDVAVPHLTSDRRFQLINHRYAARLPTVFTVGADDLSRLEERVLARLNDPVVCTEVPIIAPSYRTDLNREPPPGAGRVPRGRPSPAPRPRPR